MLSQIVHIFEKKVAPRGPKGRHATEGRIIRMV
jgi:hypothetical protein